MFNHIGSSQESGKEKTRIQVVHEISECQRYRNFKMCSMLYLRNSNDPFIDGRVTCDEKFILYGRHEQTLTNREKPNF